MRNEDVNKVEAIKWGERENNGMNGRRVEQVVNLQKKKKLNDKINNTQNKEKGKPEKDKEACDGKILHTHDMCVCAGVRVYLYAKFAEAFV